jgi:hypothetical protein
MLSKDTHPEKDVYYLGALVVGILEESSDKKEMFFDIFQILKSKENISINLFLFTLDWLFISGFIKNDNHYIKKCF